MYATKPVFILFAAGSETRKEEARRRKEEVVHLAREGGREIWGEKKKNTKNNSRYMFQIRQGKLIIPNTFWEKQIVN